MNTAKTIQIFLPDGNPRSVKIGEITSRTIQVVSFPRANLSAAAKRPELRNVGVYFLIGSDDEERPPLLYIGEAEDCLTRLQQHNKSKDFWNTAVTVISKTSYFTKTHIKYLESYCYAAAEKAGRYTLENGNRPNKPFVPESMEADLLDNFDTMKILVATLGFPIFEEIAKPTRKDILICKGKAAKAEGEYTEDGLVVFAGSTCNLVEVPSASDAIKNRRKQLVRSGVLKRSEDVYVFTRDHIFNSPSTAADVVLAHSANGWTSWKYKDGKTLDEVKRQGGE